MSGQLSLILIVGLAYLVAGFVKGLVGMGLPQVALGILAAVMTPGQAAAILIAPSLATNVWQAAAGPYLRDLLRRLAGMFAGLFVGAWLGAGLLTGSNTRLAFIGLGVVLMTYAVIGLSNIRFSLRRNAEIWVGPVVGIATGVVMAATGVFVIPALLYLEAIGLETEELIQALGLHFTLSTIALALVLWSGSAFDLSVGALSLLALVPAVIGMALGQALRRRTDAKTFRRYFFGIIFLLGANLILRGLV
jgi:uncharacterized membrane protein YfcA